MLNCNLDQGSVFPLQRMIAIYTLCTCCANKFIIQCKVHRVQADCCTPVYCGKGVLLGHYHFDTLLNRTSAMQSMLVESSIRMDTHEHEGVSFSRPVLHSTQPPSSGELFLECTVTARDSCLIRCEAKLLRRHAKSNLARKGVPYNHPCTSGNRCAAAPSYHPAPPTGISFPLLHLEMRQSTWTLILVGGLKCSPGF